MENEELYFTIKKKPNGQFTTAMHGLTMTEIIGTVEVWKTTTLIELLSEKANEVVKEDAEKTGE